MKFRNKFILLSTVFLSISVMAYTPKLLLIDQGYMEKQFLDEKSITRIDKSLMRVVIYEKYEYKKNDEYARNYQSAIKTYIVDCPYKALSVGEAKFYSGQTSNSEMINRMQNIYGMDGETGQSFEFYDDLTFESIKNSFVGQKIYKRVCIGK